MTAILVGAVPSGWLASAVTLLVVPSVPDEGTDVALALGGVLVAGAGLRKLGLACSDLTGAAVAWVDLSPLLGPSRPPAAPSNDDAGSDRHVLVEARDLHFTRAGRRRPTLQGATITIRRGDRVVLDGPSGGGKSTLVAMLCGLRAPEQGQITRHGRLTPVPQFHENHVFSASLAFNLLCGRRWPARAEDLAEADNVCRELGSVRFSTKCPQVSHSLSERRAGNSPTAECPP